MRVACLFDGTAWGLVMPDHLFALSTVSVLGNEKIHATLLDAYLENHSSFSAIPDDGYIMQVGIPLCLPSICCHVWMLSLSFEGCRDQCSGKD